MGEMNLNSPGYRTTAQRQAMKAHRLTDAMIGALESGRPSFGTANVLGRSGTIVALIERGLVTAGTRNQWTELGYQVAAAVLSGRTPTWAEGHPEPIQPSAHARRAVGEDVVCVGGDSRVWTIASIAPGDPAIGVKPWASLVHHPSRYETVTTTASLDRLSPAPATLQPATSQTGATLTPAGLADATADHDLTALLNLDDALMTRVIQRAQYEGIVAVREALGDEPEGVGSLGEPQFTHADVEAMLNDAARALGVRLPVTK